MVIVSQQHWTESGRREVFKKILRFFFFNLQIFFLYIWLCRGLVVAHEVSGCKLSN